MRYNLTFEHLDVGGATPRFLDYWDKIANGKKPVLLSGKTSMERLDKARGVLKHQGLLPSALEVEGFRASVTSFLEDNSRTAFNIEFDRVSMVDLVASASVRSCLELAAAAIDKNDTLEAIKQVAIAFHRLLEPYDVTRNLLGRRPSTASPAEFGFSVHRRPDDDINETMSTLNKDEERRWAADSVETLASAVGVLALGLDYRRFALFRVVTPRVYHRVSGAYQTAPMFSIPTKQTCGEGLAFVVDCALRVQA